MRCFGGLPVRTIEDNLIMWSPVEDRSLVFTIPGLSLPLVSEDALAAALTDLVYARALPPQDDKIATQTSHLKFNIFSGSMYSKSYTTLAWQSASGERRRVIARDGH